jgi:hypothetical protein
MTPFFDKMKKVSFTLTQFTHPHPTLLDYYTPNLD